MKTKEEIIKRYAENNEDKLFLAQLIDKYNKCKMKNFQTSTKFMDLHQRSIAQNVLTEFNATNYLVYGGYDSAERCVIIFYPDYLDKENVIDEINIPLSLIRAEKSDVDMLSHRDYLGSIMGLGIRRECVGDIVLNKYGADIIVLKEMEDYVMLEFSKAGRKRLEVSRSDIADLRNALENTNSFTESVASLRLDCVVSSAFNISRSEAAKAISKGIVFLNFQQVFKNEKEVKINDSITLRGKGKVDITGFGGISRKGRQFITIKRYL